LHRSDLLAEMMEGYAPLLVTGTHGKTTTSSLLAHLLCKCHLDPSYAVGGIVQSLGLMPTMERGSILLQRPMRVTGRFYAILALCDHY